MSFSANTNSDVPSNGSGASGGAGVNSPNSGTSGFDPLGAVSDAITWFPREFMTLEYELVSNEISYVFSLIEWLLVNLIAVFIMYKALNAVFGDVVSFYGDAGKKAANAAAILGAI